MFGSVLSLLDVVRACTNNVWVDVRVAHTRTSSVSDSLVRRCSPRSFCIDAATVALVGDDANKLDTFARCDRCEMACAGVTGADGSAFDVAGSDCVMYNLVALCSSAAQHKND